MRCAMKAFKEYSIDGALRVLGLNKMTRSARVRVCV